MIALLLPTSALLKSDTVKPQIWTASLSKFTAAGTVEKSLFPLVLGWNHYVVFLRLDNVDARAFYEIEAARENWSSRELERQVNSMMFERLATSRDRNKVLALAKRGHDVEAPHDLIKGPFALEFLDLPERHTWIERDLEP